MSTKKTGQNRHIKERLRRGEIRRGELPRQKKGGPQRRPTETSRKKNALGSLLLERAACRDNLPRGAGDRFSIANSQQAQRGNLALQRLIGDTRGKHGETG